VASLDSVAAHSRWLAEQLLAGTIDPIIAREVKEQHRTLLTSLRQRHAQSELAQMRELVGRAEKAADRAKKNVADDRFRQDEDLGRERPAPCAAPAPSTSSASGGSVGRTPPTDTQS
jgi:hypothetical protein